MGYKRSAPKQPVNMTLNEDLVRRARGLSTNLSETVESLLAGFVEEMEAKIAAPVVANEIFVAKYGSLADELSEL
jgi:antitoxin CcdA